MSNLSILMQFVWSVCFGRAVSFFLLCTILFVLAFFPFILSGFFLATANASVSCLFKQKKKKNEILAFLGRVKAHGTFTGRKVILHAHTHVQQLYTGT